MKKLSSKIAKMEGKKSQVSSGNIREVIKCLQEIFFDEIMSQKKAKPLTSQFLNPILKRIDKTGGYVHINFHVMHAPSKVAAEKKKKNKE